MSTEKMVFIKLRCTKCRTPADDPENPQISIQEKIEKYNSYSGWLCKCGHYNGLDP